MEFKTCAGEILAELNQTLGGVNESEIAALFPLITNAGRVFFTGGGRVLLSLEAIAKRWNHLGIETCVVGQITEPAITADDVLIVGSGSGESVYPLAIAAKAKKFGATVIHIGPNPDCSMAAYSDLFIRIPASSKTGGAVSSIQPMTSLFEQSLLLLGDTVALMYIREHNLDLKGLWRFHANLE